MEGGSQDQPKPWTIIKHSINGPFDKHGDTLLQTITDLFTFNWHNIKRKRGEGDRWLHTV